MEEARNSESVEKGVIEIDTSQKEVMGRSSQRPIHINSDKVCQVTQVLMLGNLNYIKCEFPDLSKHD